MDDPVECHSEDKLFEPTIDMMVNDFDDEQTLEEEENLQTDPQQDQQELDSLQRESEMPIEELMRLYNMPVAGGPDEYRGRSSKSRKKRKHNTTLVNNNPEEPAQDESADRKAARLAEQDAPPVALAADDSGARESGGDGAETPARSPATTADEAGDPEVSEVAPGPLSEEEDEETADGPSELVQLLDDVQDEEEEDYDYDYYPEDTDLKKAILVGDNHQADIPDAVPPADAASDAWQTPDQLLWSPHSDKVDDVQVECFLAQFHKLRRQLNRPESAANDSLVVTSGVVKDEERALEKLLEADYNVERALQQVCRLMQSNGELSSGGYCGTAPAVTWTEEECRDFELGIRLYGKNFSLIHSTKVPGRSVQELVQFYYYWKKTERYDSFAAKQRLEKKRHSGGHQNPGLTEFMDRFLEEQQPRSLSPKQSSLTPATPSPPPVPVTASADLMDSLVGHGSHLLEGLVAEETGALLDEAVLDGNHSLLIYADSKRQSRGAGVPTTPPVQNACSADARHPLDQFKGAATELEACVEDMST